MRRRMTLAHTTFSPGAEEPRGGEGRCVRGSRGSSPLMRQESSGANYCRQRRLLLACVSKTAAPTPSHIPRLYLLMTNVRSVNEGSDFATITTL